MEPVTMIMILVGIAVLGISCFLTKGETAETDYDEFIKRFAKRELSAEETARIRQAVDQIISEKTEEVILKTDDYLSKVANEKIMSVDEFSKQILERLDKNNSDVMFLYNMVSETKDELKTEIANAKKVQESLANAVEKKTENGKAAASKKTEGVRTGSEVKKTAQPKKPVGNKAAESNAVNDITELLAAAITEEPVQEKEVDMPKEKIVELYKKGKNVREISRELGMGQGEVKLVIDLYGMQ